MALETTPEGASPSFAHRSATAATWLPALVVLLVVAIAVAGYALARTPGAAAATPPPGTITVTGTGTIEGTPNTVQFSIGVHSSAYTAIGALHENDAKIARLIETFHRYGVPDKDMQTTNVSIYEQTDRYGTFTGFGVDENLQVTVPSVSTAGRAIDAAVRLVGGGIQFNGVSFSISNESALLASARARAMQSAFTDASQLAKGGNETVGPIVKVTTQVAPTYFPYGGYGMPLAMNAAAFVPLERGQQPVSVQVTVEYDLVP